MDGHILKRNKLVSNKTNILLRYRRFRFLSTIFLSNVAWCTYWSMWDFFLHSAVVLSTDVFILLCVSACPRELLNPNRDHPCPSLHIRLPLQDLLLEPAVLVVFFFLLWCAGASLWELLVPRRDHPCPRWCFLVVVLTTILDDLVHVSGYSSPLTREIHVASHCCFIYVSVWINWRQVCWKGAPHKQ